MFAKAMGMLTGSGACPRGYEYVDQVPRGSGGPGFLWTMFSVKRSGSSKQFSLFVLDKQLLGKRLRDKAVRVAVLERLRADIKGLSTMRHPHVLQVEETVEETAAHLAFVAEPVANSLANACGDLRGLHADKIRPELRESALSQFEITVGLSHLSSALQFFHCEAGVAHGDLCPANVWLTVQGKPSSGHTLSHSESHATSARCVQYFRSKNLPPPKVYYYVSRFSFANIPGNNSGSPTMYGRAGRWKVGGLGFMQKIAAGPAESTVLSALDPHVPLRGPLSPLSPALPFAAPEVRALPFRYGGEPVWPLLLHSGDHT